MNIWIDLRIAANRPPTRPDHARRRWAARTRRRRALRRRGDHGPVLVDDTPAVRVKDGRAFFDDTLRRERLTRPEFGAILHRHGAISLATARSAILEEDSLLPVLAGYRPC